MDPATTCCPHRACPASGQTGQGTRGLPSCKATRCIGTECPKPCSATTGTACSRRRTSAEPVSLVVTLMAHGCPRPARVGAFALAYARGPVAAWWTRAGRQGQAVQEPLVEHPRDLGPVPADDIRVQPPGGIGWLALARMVTTRWWRAGEGSAPRDRTWSRRRRERGRAWALPRPLLCGPDGWCSSLRALREPLRAPVRPGAHGRPRWRPWRPVCLAQVVKRSAPRRVVDVERRLVEGPPARVETLRRRAHGGGVSQTASSERLNATGRARLAALTRRGRARARRTLTLQQGRDLRGTVENVCPPQARLAPAGGGTPPARAAGITEQGWPVRDRWSFPVPPPRGTPPTPRGRPSQALKRLIERWCGNHG